VRVLHILDHSLPLHSGYTFRTRALLKAQQAKGWHVLGVTGARHSMAGPDVEEVEGLTFHRSSAPKAAPAPLGEWREVKALANKVESLIETFKPDILHAHSPLMSGLAGLQVAKRHRLPILYEIRAFWEDAAVGNGTGSAHSLKYFATKRLETYVCKQVDAIAVICEGLRDDLTKRGITRDKIMVSPNGVDLDLFGDPPPRDEQLAAELGLNNVDVVGYVGSFYDYEGIDDLIAALPMIKGPRPAHLLLVGGGPMEPQLRAQALASPAADRIHFIGRVPHSEVERYYSLIDILAYPRKKMRLTDLVTPLKPLEAMAQRRMVAASSVGGHRELIEDGVTGTLFAPDDPVACAAALSTLLFNKDNWDTRREVARAYVERDRNWLSNISRYEPVYQRLTGRTV